MMAPQPNPAAVASNLADVLVANKLATASQYQQWLIQSQASGTSVIEVIEETKAIREEDFVRAKAQAFNLPAVDLFGRVVAPDILNSIPQELATNYKIVAYQREDGTLDLAMVDPTNYKAMEAVEFLARKNRFKVRYHVISLSGFHYILRQYESLTSEVQEALKRTGTRGKVVEEELVKDEKVQEVIRAAPVSKIVAVILRHAVEGKASDVHIEPMHDATRVRYRVDGVLHTSLVLPKHIHSSLVARIKVLCNMKIDETRTPQDGRFRMTIEGHDIDYRVSTLPVVGDEKVVMRILDTTSSVLELDKLGYWGRPLDVMHRNIHKPHGMLLITGPTGSGKSTTMYAILKILNEEGVNIITLEDPVEYYIQGVNQSQINPEVGLTFARGLRSILRQDPDVIMVGEIRDDETAELAVHASLTGHIVLSTLHTNDAFGAVPRLMDMNIEPFLITSSLNVVIAQRLVRKICQHCREPLEIAKDIVGEVVEAMKGVDPSALPPNMSMKPPFSFFKGKGCIRCENTGYKGRLAISEVFEITDDVKKLIVAGSDPEKMAAEFYKQGMLSMKQDGIVKALQGQTSIEEVWRVTKG